MVIAADTAKFNDLFRIACIANSMQHNKDWAGRREFKNHDERRVAQSDHIVACCDACHALASEIEPDRMNPIRRGAFDRAAKMSDEDWDFVAAQPASESLQNRFIEKYLDLLVRR